MNRQHHVPLLARAVAVCGLLAWTAPAAGAQTTYQIALNYNFNGIVHAGEAGDPDNPSGFRSISDRALDFTGGVPNDPLLTPFSIVSSAGVLDMVHLGNRDKVAGGAHMFDATADGDDVGTQPTWLPAVDQSGPQTTKLLTPIPIAEGNSSSASFLYLISNGGGSFDVTFGFESGKTFTATLSGPDWFNGNFKGTGSVDQGTPDNNLSITQGDVDLSALGGETLVSITFENRSNTNGDYGIIAANVVSATMASSSSRNAGTNPESYTLDGAPILGTTVIATVDLGGTTGHDEALLVGFRTPLTMLLPGGQTLLVDPNDSAGELLGLPLRSGPTALFGLGIPSDTSLIGFTLSTQAIHVGGVVPFALSNANDLVLGL